MLEHSSAFWTKKRQLVRKVKKRVSQWCFALNRENMGKGKKKKKRKLRAPIEITVQVCLPWSSGGNQFARVVRVMVSPNSSCWVPHVAGHIIYAWACLKLWTLFSWMGSTEVLTKFKIKQFFKFILHISNH